MPNSHFLVLSHRALLDVESLQNVVKWQYLLQLSYWFQLLVTSLFSNNLVPVLLCSLSLQISWELHIKLKLLLCTSFPERHKTAYVKTWKHLNLHFSLSGFAILYPPVRSGFEWVSRCHCVQTNSKSKMGKRLACTSFFPFASFSFFIFFQVNVFDYNLINILHIRFFDTCSSTMSKQEHKSAKS